MAIKIDQPIVGFNVKQPEDREAEEQSLPPKADVIQMHEKLERQHRNQCFKESREHLFKRSRLFQRLRSRKQRRFLTKRQFQEKKTICLA